MNRSKSRLARECYLSLELYDLEIFVFLSHRVERITASGGEVGRLNIVGGAEVHSFFKKIS